jgi:hypothetical protein
VFPVVWKHAFLGKLLDELQRDGDCVPVFRLLDVGNAGSIVSRPVLLLAFAAAVRCNLAAVTE